MDENMNIDAAVYSILIESAFTNYGRLGITEGGVTLAKRSFMKYSEWQTIPFSGIENLSMEKPHLTLKDSKGKRVAITFLEPTPLVEVIARLRARMLGKPETDKTSTETIENSELRPPPGFIGWLIAPGESCRDGRLLRSFGIASILAGVVPLIREFSADNESGGAFLLAGILLLGVAGALLSAGYKRYIGGYSRIVEEVKEKAAGLTEKGDRTP